jgi:hypothetical protein
MKKLFGCTVLPTPKIAGKILRVLHVNPNVYAIDNFLSDKEMRDTEAIATPLFKKYKISAARRHSSQMARDLTKLKKPAERDYPLELKYLRLPKFESAIARKLEERAAELVGESSTNVEPIGIICQDDLDFFSLHHSFGNIEDGGKSIDSHILRRLTTLYTYIQNFETGLCKLVFPKLGLSVYPHKGMAVLFCNVLPNGMPDVRVQHYSVPWTINSASPTNAGSVASATAEWCGRQNSTGVADDMCRYNAVGPIYPVLGLKIWITDTNLQELTGLDGGEEGSSLLPRPRKRRRGRK